MASGYILLYILLAVLFILFFLLSLLQEMISLIFASPLKRFEKKVDKICSAHYYDGSRTLEDAQDLVLDYVMSHDGDYDKFHSLFECTMMPLEHDNRGDLVQQIGWSNDLYRRLEMVDNMFKKRAKFPIKRKLFHH